MSADDASDAISESSESRALVPLRWPADAAGDPSEDIPCRCEACGQAWSVHRDLASYRLRCRCGAWVAIAALDAPSSSAELAPRSTHEMSPVPRAMHDLLLFAPPDDRTRVDPAVALPAGDLVDARNVVRQAWTTRTFLELFLVFAALLGPWIVLALTLEGRRQVVLQPLASLVSCFLVMGVGLLAPGYTYAALTRAKSRYYLEAVGATLLALAFAFAWGWLLRNTEFSNGSDEDFVSPLRQEAGLGMALFVVAFCPGVFEEFAFRGLLQGRLSALFGGSQGIVLTGLAFALAHGLSLAFPVHIALGLYLCWLRSRAGSLLPGMMLHMLYNGTLVAFG